MSISSEFLSCSLKLLRSHLPGNVDTSDGQLMMEVQGQDSAEIVKRAVYELVQKGLKGILRRADVATALGEATLLHPEMGSTIVDILALTDAETTSLAGASKEERDRLPGECDEPAVVD